MSQELEKARMFRGDRTGTVPAWRVSSMKGTGNEFVSRFGKVLGSQYSSSESAKRRRVIVTLDGSRSKVRT
jgi:hypothetical protein